MKHAFILVPATALCGLCLLTVFGCAQAPAEMPAAAVAAAAPPALAAVPVATASGQPPSEVRFGKFSLGMPMEDALKVFGSSGETGRDAHGATTHRYLVGGGHANLTLLAAPFRPDYLYGIQVTGTPDAALAPIAGVHLGDTAYDLLSRLGEPTSRQPVPDKDRTFWIYDGRNYSFELSSGGDVLSIRMYGYAGVMTGLGWPAVWERYRPNSIGAATGEQRAGWEDGSVYVASAGVPFRPRVTFTGDVRDTPQEVLDQISAWARTSPDAVSAGMYTKSIRVMDSGVGYWLPIQTGRLKPFQDAVKPGAAVDLFVIWLGAGNGNADPALIVNEFCGCSWESTAE